MVSLKNATYSNSDKSLSPEPNEQGKNNIPYKDIDENEWRKVRRRMKNKLSAQESRRRKKAYVDTLEIKLKQRDQEKNLLKDKVTELEENVRLLVDELFTLKKSKNHGQENADSSDVYLKQSQPHCVSQITRATQTGTCLQCFLNQIEQNKECDYIDIKRYPEQELLNVEISNDNAGLYLSKNMTDYTSNSVDMKRIKSDGSPQSKSEFYPSTCKLYEEGIRTVLSQKRKDEYFNTKSNIIDVRASVEQIFSFEKCNYYTRSDILRKGESLISDNATSKNIQEEKTLYSQLMQTEHDVSPSHT